MLLPSITYKNLDMWWNPYSCSHRERQMLTYQIQKTSLLHRELSWYLAKSKYKWEVLSEVSIRVSWTRMLIILACHYPLEETAQPFPYQSHHPHIKYISLQFKEKDVVGKHVKDLTEAQIDDIHSSSLVHWCNYSITEGQEICFWGSQSLNLGS